VILGLPFVDRLVGDSPALEIGLVAEQENRWRLCRVNFAGVEEEVEVDVETENVGIAFQQLTSELFS
jgi:hypothetical protein